MFLSNESLRKFKKFSFHLKHFKPDIFDESVKNIKTVKNSKIFKTVINIRSIDNSETDEYIENFQKY